MAQILLLLRHPIYEFFPENKLWFLDSFFSIVDPSLFEINGNNDLTSVDQNIWFDLMFGVERHFQQYFSYIMATSFSGERGRNTRSEPPTMGKQLVSCFHLRLRVECTLFVIYKAGGEPTSYFPVYVPSVVSTSQSFPHSWLITGFLTRVTRSVPLSGAGTAHPSVVYEFTTGFSGIRVAWILVFYVVFCSVVCLFVLFLLDIVLSVLFRFTDSDYPFGIFKLFLCVSPLTNIYPSLCMKKPIWMYSM